MNDTIQIQLQTVGIKELPFQSYAKNFTFIVNGEEIQTSQIIADILSPKICKIHFSDPTFDNYVINTKQKGNFQYFLNLINLDPEEISRNETQFIKEIIEDLGNNSIVIHDKIMDSEISCDTVLNKIKIHLKNNIFYSKQIQEDIEYISSHFSDIYKVQNSELMNLPLNILEMIINNPKLQLETEDQLLYFINELYESKSDCFFLFEYVDFLYATSNAISEFLSIYNIEDITQEIWKRLSVRLRQKILKDDYKKYALHDHKKEYYERNNSIYIPYKANNEFNGIFNYLQKKSNGNISEVVEAKSFKLNSDDNIPMNVLMFDDPGKIFFSEEDSNAWLCFDFKNHRVIPSNYTIKKTEDFCYPKSWVIEASNDEENWEILDEQINVRFFDHENFHTFSICNENEKRFRFIRLRMTDSNSSGVSSCIIIDSFEFYGMLY